MNIISDIIQSVFHTFFPKKCLFCKEILSDKEHTICNKCRNLYPYGDISFHDDFFAPLLPYVEQICILGWYTYMKEAILDFKFNENLYKGRIVSELLCDRLEQTKWITDIDYIVPVPLYKTRQRQRGFNQSELISDVIAKRFNKTVIVNNLIRKSDNKAQHRLSGQERYTNVKGIFDLTNRFLFADKNILLVDDVITTCSTAAECCKTLKKSDNVKIYLCCLATDRHHI